MDPLQPVEVEAVRRLHSAGIAIPVLVDELGPAPGVSGVDDLGHGFCQTAVAFFALAEIGFGLTLGRDVDGDTDHTGRVARSIAEQRYRNSDVKCVTLPVPVAEFQCEVAVPEERINDDIAEVGLVLLEVQERNMASDRLVSRIAGDRLGTMIPGGDNAPEVGRDNGIVDLAENGGLQAECGFRALLFGNVTPVHGKAAVGRWIGFVEVPAILWKVMVFEFDSQLFRQRAAKFIFENRAATIGEDIPEDFPKHLFAGVPVRRSDSALNQT